MKKSVWVAAVVALAVAPAAAQLKLGQNSNLDLTIRRSSNGPQYGKSAIVSYTKASDQTASYAMDAALGLNYAFMDQTDARYQGKVGMTAEVHSNTAISKEQNKTMVGLAAMGQINLDAKRNWSLLPDFAILSEHDKQANTQGASVNANLRVRSKPLLIGDVIGPKWFPFEYEPLVGLQHVSEKDATGTQGRVSRWTAAVTVNAYPGGFDPVRGWKLYYTGALWTEMSESGILQDGRKRQYFREGGLSYRFMKNFALGLKHVSGENPAEGLQEQKFTQVALEIFF